MPHTSLTHYRIKGLHEVTKPKLDPLPNEGADPNLLMGQLLRAIGQPHLTDHLYHTKALNRLSSCWPTFTYVRRRAKSTAIKDVPLRLIAFMDYSAEDEFCQKIFQEAERQQVEEAGIEGLLWDESEGGDSTLDLPPLTTALACYLRRGSPWLKEHRMEMLERILESSAAAYIAMNSGLYREDSSPLLDKIAEHPSLLLEAWQCSVIRHSAKAEWWREALQPYPIHHALQLFLVGHGREALEVLNRAAESDPISAGVSLGLQPHHRKTNLWLKVARGAVESFYWLRKVYKASGRDISTHPQALDAATELLSDPRWHYHSLRDTGGELNDEVNQLWPSLWAAELVEDLGASKELVLSMYNGSKQLDPTHPVDSTLLLWGADYILPDAS